MGLLLGELAERLGAELHGDCTDRVEAVATLERAQPGDISFFSNRRYKKHLLETAATAVILARHDLDECPVASLVVENPYLGYARAAAIFNPSPDPPHGIHPSARVEADACVHATAWVGPNAIIESNAHVGEGAYIGPMSVVGKGARVGPGTCLVANVILCHGVEIGSRGVIHPGVVIGADGFGIANDNGVWVKVPQLGSVKVGDDVEIGANTSIDRGALEDTVIELGVKLDNQIQIGHNVRIGAHTAIAGCVCIAGSARVGSRCTIGGAVSIGGHLEIADDVHITGGTLVPKSITRPGIYSSGLMALDNRSWKRAHARFSQLDDMARRLKALEDEAKR